VRSSCAKMHSLMPSAVEGELDESARAVVAAHTGRCEACADAWSFHVRLREGLEGDPAGAPPPVYFEGVLAEIHRRMPVPVSLRPRRARISLDRPQLASAVMSGLFAIWLLAGFAHRMPGPTRSAAGGVERASIAPSGDREVLSAQVLRHPRLVAVDGIGLVSEDSPILRMSSEMLGELGLGCRGSPSRLRPSRRLVIG